MTPKISSTGVEFPDGTTQTSRATDYGNCPNCSSYSSLTNKPGIPNNFSNCSGDVNSATSIAECDNSMQCYQCSQCHQCYGYSTGGYYTWTVEKTGTSPGKLIPF